MKEGTGPGGRTSSLTWVGVALFGVGIMVEGVVTGTAYEQRLPNAALFAWLLMLVAVELMLLGYRRQLAGAGLPPNPALMLWATLGTVALVVGWGNLRGAIRDLDESWRSVFVLAGVPAGLLGWALAIYSLVSWMTRLSPKQQDLHWERILPWLFALPAVTIGAALGTGLISLVIGG